MRIIQALGILITAVGCHSATQPNLIATNEVVATPPTAPGSFGDDRPPEDRSKAPDGTTPPGAPDPIVTDGDKYHVILENSRVRVLRYQDKPGDKTSPHHHAEFVLYALSSFRRRLTFPDGSVRERDFKPGDVIWMPDQVHTGENTGTTNTDVIIVENKLAAGAPRAQIPK
jgi:quercetin dioxygenase-like cupin family protein